jgi:hypothetical protein
MDAFEKCVRVTGNPQFCSSVSRTGRLVAGLTGCLMVLDAESCYRICLEGCQGEECAGACLGVLKVAMGVVEAGRIARRAAEAAALLGADLVNTVALAFDAELKKAREMNCPERGTAAQILAAAAVQLYANFKTTPGLQEHAQDVLLLVAPAFAEAYQCVGEAVFDYLDYIRPFVAEEAIKRIVATMEEGVALVGNVIIKFPPVKTQQ